MTSLASIAKEIRVPELRYQVVEAESANDSISVLIGGFLNNIREGINVGIMEFINQDCPDTALSPEYFNYCFLTDRIFDVWCRKSKLDPRLIEMVSPWRFLFLSILWRDQEAFSDLSHPLVGLLDLVSESQLGWTAYPERSGRPLLEMLKQLSGDLGTEAAMNSDTVGAASEKFNAFITQQAARREKLDSRLIKTEQGLSNQFFAEQKSRYLLNRLFAGKTIPVSVHRLLVDGWQPILRKALINPERETDIEEIEIFTKKLAQGFLQGGQYLVAIADNLIDTLTEMASKFQFALDSTVLEKIQKDVIELLQKHAVASTEFESFEMELDFSQNYSDLEKLKGEWFFREEGTHASRVQCTEIMQFSRELLFLNHAGVKAAKMTVDVLKQQKSTGILRPIGRPYLFSQVIIDALKGLSKVASAQKDARQKAAEKARAEAAALEKARQEAELKAKIQAEEIASRAEEMKQQQKQRIRAARESDIIKQLSSMGLGSWIDVCDSSGKPEKYKLVVKLNATNKFIFVDKLGVKKFEIRQAELIDKIIDDEIQILNEGAEFEDLLERVVGRMRINNK